MIESCISTTNTCKFETLTDVDGTVTGKKNQKFAYLEDVLLLLCPDPSWIPSLIRHYANIEAFQIKSINRPNGRKAFGINWLIFEDGICYFIKNFPEQVLIHNIITCKPVTYKFKTWIREGTIQDNNLYADLKEILEILDESHMLPYYLNCGHFGIGQERLQHGDFRFVIQGDGIGYFLHRSGTRLVDS